MAASHERILEGKKALITGASRGIGKAIAECFAANGASIVINYHSSSEAADDLAEQLLARHSELKVLTIQADVRREDEVRGLFAKTQNGLGGLDILVVNAGIQADAASHEMTLEQWQKVIDTDLTGSFLVCREALKIFLSNPVKDKQGHKAEAQFASRGNIIGITSVHDRIPWAGHANYAAAKAGQKMLLQSLAQEYGPERIRVNAIAPGAIKTDINEEVWSDPKSAADLRTLIPYGRIGRPEDVALAALWLASDASDYVTGETLYIDGGMMLYPGFADNG